MSKKAIALDRVGEIPTTGVSSERSRFGFDRIFTDSSLDGYDFYEDIDGEMRTSTGKIYNLPIGQGGEVNNINNRALDETN